MLVDVGVGETLHLKVGYFNMTYLMVERAEMKIKIHLCLEVTLPSPLLFLLAAESREVMSVTVKLNMSRDETIVIVSIRNHETG